MLRSQLQFEFPPHLNPYLDEWVIEHRDLDKAQCISLLEYRHVINLSKLDTIKYVLSVLTGFESNLFKLNKHGQFEPQSGFALAQLNSEKFRQFLKQFAEVGTMYHVMDRFCEKEYIRGGAFVAFQVALKYMLGEILEKVLEVRQHFTHHSKPVNDKTIGLIALPCFLNQDQYGNIIRSIKNLYATYLEASCEKPTAPPTSIPSQVERLYTCQVLEALFKRSLLPDRRIRSFAFTMLDHCLGSVFRTLEAHLTTLSSLTSSRHFLFHSQFESDDEIEFTHYTPETIDQFWYDLLAPHEDLKKYTFFRFNSLPSLVEAIKCSYALRKNHIQLESNRFVLSKRFRENLTECFRIWAHPDEEFDLFQNEKVDVYKFEDNILGLPDVRSRRFQCYKLPLRLMYDLGTLIHRAMDQTFNQVSQPLISHFLLEFRAHYLHLLNFYTDLYLVQRSDHIVHYLHYFFPQLKTLIALKPRSSSEPVFERLLRVPTEDSYFAELARVFRPSIFNANSAQFEELSTHQALFEVFEQFFFLPKFTSDSREFYNFWPLSQLFNSNVTEVFNQLFQMLLKLRYFQYLIGEDFLLSDRFRFGNDLNKQTYLFRFRLANLIFLFGRQTEAHLRKLLVQTEKRLDEATTLAKFLEEHQRFLRRLLWIRDTLKRDRFFSSLLTTVAKFCAPIGEGGPNKRSRRDSIYQTVQGLDRIYQNDFYHSIPD